MWPRLAMRAEFVLALALCLFCGKALAQTPGPPQDPPQPVATCPPLVLRWLENCSVLRDQPRPGLTALRYLPLTDDGSAWLTIGGEYRTRVESFDRIDFGINGAPDYTAFAQRVLAHTDLRTRGGARLFVQMSAADQDGREPGPRAFDESGVDLAQGFVDLPFRVGNADASLRVGRQEVSVGNRLVALRDGVTLRRAFDGAKLDLRVAGASGTIFYLSPVQNRPDAFDDRNTPGETFGGVSIDLPRDPGAPTWSLFAFDRRRQLARYASVSGKERRQTFGVRYAHASPSSDLIVQGGLQTGSVADNDVLAWGGSLDFGWRPSGPNPPRFGLSLGAASGDSDPSDGELNTFDPLYPNLGAFTEAPLYYYSNQVNVQANAQRRFGAVTLRADVTLTGRYTVDDAIYTTPGRPLASPPGDARLSAVLVQASARWPVRPGVEIYASVLRGEALDAIRAAGGSDVTFGLVQLTAAF